MDNITKINFTPDKDYIWGIEGLKQWDQGQKLEISGLDISDEIVEVHFSLQEYGGAAKRMLGTVKDGIIHVDIPAFILEGEGCCGSVYCAYAWVYVSDEESAETIRKMEFLIEGRSKPEDYVTPEELSFLQQLEAAIKNKLDKSGYTPNKFLGTDTEGNVVEKDAPEGSGGGSVTDEQIAESVENYLTEHPIEVEVPTKTSDLTNDSGYITNKDLPSVPTKTSQLTNDSGFITEIPKDLGKTHIIKYGDSIGNITSNIEGGEDYACKFSFINKEPGLYDNHNGELVCSMESMIQDGLIDVYLDDACFYGFNDELIGERVYHDEGLTFISDIDWSIVEDIRSDYVTNFILPNIHHVCCDINAYNNQSIYSKSSAKQVEEWKESQSTNAAVKDIESFNLYGAATTILMSFVRIEEDEYLHYVYFSRLYQGIEYVAGYDWESDYWYYESREYANAYDLPTKTSELENDSGFVESPTTAEVGQMLVVKAVDENGVPTEWEVSDVASGGSGEWTLLIDETLTEDVSSLTINTKDTKAICVVFKGCFNNSDNTKSDANATCSIKSSNNRYCYLGQIGYVRVNRGITTAVIVEKLGVSTRVSVGNNIDINPMTYTQMLSYSTYADSITINPDDTELLFKAGGTLKVWGLV